MFVKTPKITRKHINELLYVLIDGLIHKSKTTLKPSFDSQITTIKIPGVLNTTSNQKLSQETSWSHLDERHKAVLGVKSSSSEEDPTTTDLITTPKPYGQKNILPSNPYQLSKYMNEVLHQEQSHYYQHLTNAGLHVQGHHDQESLQNKPLTRKQYLEDLESLEHR
jgi:hypothetical protein